MSLPDDHARRITRGDQIAALLPGADLPGWVHQRSDGKFWARPALSTPTAPR
jgi:hypothetical protein